jgi:L-fuculose-phosphate aldolase
MKYLIEREAVVQACRQLMDNNLVVGTAGNVSLRVDDVVVISPSGFDYRVMLPQHVVVTDLQGNVIDGDYQPSSELPLHLAVYATSEHRAIAHTHAVASTALSCVVNEVPLSHYYSALFGGSIRVAEYALYGSDELAVNVQRALENRTAALMSNHGAVSVGPTLAKAMDQLVYLEYVCEVELRAAATGLPVKYLSQEQLGEVTAKLKGYGQQPR